MFGASILREIEEGESCPKSCPNLLAELIKSCKRMIIT